MQPFASLTIALLVGLAPFLGVLRVSRESEYGEHEGPCDAGDWRRLAPDETERDAHLLGGRVGEDMEPHRKDGL